MQGYTCSVVRRTKWSVFNGKYTDGSADGPQNKRDPGFNFILINCSDDESQGNRTPRLIRSPRKPPPDPIHSVDDDTIDIASEYFKKDCSYVHSS